MTNHLLCLPLKSGGRKKEKLQDEIVFVSEVILEVWQTIKTVIKQHSIIFPQPWINAFA